VRRLSLQAATILRWYQIAVCNPKQWQVSENVITDRFS